MPKKVRKIAPKHKESIRHKDVSKPEHEVRRTVGGSRFGRIGLRNINVRGSLSRFGSSFHGVRSHASRILHNAKKTRAAVLARDRIKALSALPKPPQLLRWDLLGVSLSYLWGKIHRRTLPSFVRTPLFKLWAYSTRCNLEEMKHPLESYSTLCDFFTRELKEGARKVSLEGMSSPVDGRVVVCGEVIADRVAEVKGLTYTLSGFLGTPFDLIRKNPNTKLYHCVLYLAPGDYHRMHSPYDWSIDESRHFPGTLFPIAPTVGRLIPNLLALNERVVMSGESSEGYFSMTAVGAYNVGSISLKFDETVTTNMPMRDYTCANLQYFSWKGVGSHAYARQYDPAISVTKGEEIAQFNLGSTVVLIFESEDFQFNVENGQYVQMGTQLGVSVKSTSLPKVPILPSFD